MENKGKGTKSSPLIETGLSEVSAEALAVTRGLAVSLGRAISLSVVAGTCHASVEDHALECADAAWTALADKIITFALEA